MTNLSPASQAELDAAYESLDHRGYITDLVAAAIRAAADQVVPPEQERLFNEERPWDGELCAVVEIRAELLAIADELEGHA